MTYDFLEKPQAFALLRDDASQEMKDGCLALLTGWMDSCETRFSDGRAHCAGDHITYTDFTFLGNMTGIVKNPNGIHADIKEALTAKLANCPNIQRVVTPMEELCAASIASLPPTRV